MDIYDKIDTLLKEKHMSRRQLAIAAGIPESTLATSFMRRSRMTTENAEKIANVLGCHLVDIVSREDLTKAQDAALEIIRQVDNSTFEHLCFNSSPSSYLEQLQKIENVTPQLLNLYSSDRLLASNTQVMSSVSNIFQHTLDSLDDLFGDGSGLMLFKLADILYRLNREGQQRVFDILEDLCCIPHYQRSNSDFNTEVTQCPEDAPQTAAACSPASDQTDAGNVDSILE